MNAEPLYLKTFNGVEKYTYDEFVDGVWKFKPTNVWYCSNCKSVYQSEQDANNCCNCYYCKTLVDGKNNNDKNKSLFSYHAKCWDEEQCRSRLETRQFRFEKAIKIDAKNYNGWVYHEGSGYNEGFFESIEDFIDWWYCEYENMDGKLEQELPDYVWACNEVQFSAPDFERIIEWSCEDKWEDMPNYINGKKELQEALDKFQEANKDLKSYDPDFTRAIVNIKEIV